ncbi:hypothetical protein SLA2020_506230 [Shorea laevis]
MSTFYSLPLLLSQLIGSTNVTGISKPSVSAKPVSDPIEEELASLLQLLSSSITLPCILVEESSNYTSSQEGGNGAHCALSKSSFAVL